jgi:hypothetical protein
VFHTLSIDHRHGRGNLELVTQTDFDIGEEQILLAGADALTA